MRIVGGKFKGRALTAPDGLTTRPTSVRMRESIFNILDHQDWGRTALRNGRVLDVFSGTGALGLEALSRGAQHVSFLDQDPTALKVLATTLKKFQLPSTGRGALVQVIKGDATQPPKAQRPCDLVFMDAPYGKGLNEAAYAALNTQGWFTPKTLFVTETHKKEHWQPPQGAETLDKRHYGIADVTFWFKLS